MQPKQNPFSLYDFLGYFVPGAALLFVFIAFRQSARLEAGLFEALISAPPLQRLANLAPFVIFSYIVGHLLSFISSVTIERYSIWSLGYPSQFLLSIEPRPFWKPPDQVTLRRILRGFVILALLPVTALDYLLGCLLRFREVYSRPLDTFLQAAITRSITSLLERQGHLRKGESLPRDGDFFRLAYHYCLEHAPGHVSKLQNYVALYGFLRTTCIVSVISWWLALFYALLLDIPLWAVVISALLAAWLPFLLFMAFLKFYRRFSLEVFMAVTAIESPAAA